MRTIVALLLLSACTAARTPEFPIPEKQRGMSFAAASPRRGTYGTEASAASLRELKAMGVTWISIMPFGFHRGTPELHFGGPRIWETDESLAAVTRQAHELGLKVMLKLHVWGRSELPMDRWSESDWQTWFDGYGRMVEHYAHIGRDANVDAFCIGNEQKLATKHANEWRRMIERARGIYRGRITYGANFDEVFDVAFWDALDWIGVSGYFPLAPDATPDRETLVRAWQPIVTKLEALSRRHRKPVIFTEIGYRSADGAAWRQWEIARDAPRNLEAQRIAYEAFFEAVWPQPWVGGAYPWKWFSYVGHSDASNNDFEIEGKPAAEVVRRVYTSQATSASRSSSRR